MADPYSLALDASEGRRLSYEDYRLDFAQRDSEVIDRKSWKFERRQSFREPDDPSWGSFLRGEWGESLQLLEEEREGLLAAVREEEERGNPFCRVRVVEEPLTPYLQWELHSLRVQAECGRPVRVVSARSVDSQERHTPLPEVVVLGGQVIYEVLYTEQGVLDGAIRFDAPGLVERWESFIADLYEGGEDVISYTDRHVSNLPPPQATE